MASIKQIGVPKAGKVPTAKMPKTKTPTATKIASPMSAYTTASKGLKQAVGKYSAKLNAY